MTLPKRVAKPLYAGLFAGLFSLVAASPAFAVVITWELNNFVFEDGGVASGFFDWDTVTQDSTNFEISVSGGNTGSFPAFTWSDDSGHTQVGGTPATDVVVFTDDVGEAIRVFEYKLRFFGLLGVPIDRQLAFQSPSGIDVQRLMIEPHHDVGRMQASIMIITVTPHGK